MGDSSSSDLFSKIALGIAAAGTLIYAIAVVAGLFAATIFTGGLGLVIAIPVFIMIYIFVSLGLARWNSRHNDPYSDLEK